VIPKSQAAAGHLLLQRANQSGRAAPAAALASVHPDWVPHLGRLALVAPTAWADGVLAPDKVLRALAHTTPGGVRVVILGQDPYHASTAITLPDSSGTPPVPKACGLSFGLNPAWVELTGYRPHSSIANVLAEVERAGFTPPADLSLEGWAQQGVLLLNTLLNVSPGQPRSHTGLGWEAVVADILDALPEQPIVWLAWGRHAVDVASAHAKQTHFVYASTHPCRYSATRGTTTLRAFVGSSPFAYANDCLIHAGLPPVDWSDSYWRDGRRA
jgi:uracil-DNA glycosylase